LNPWPELAHQSTSTTPQIRSSNILGLSRNSSSLLQTLNGGHILLLMINCSGHHQETPLTPEMRLRRLMSDRLQSGHGSDLRQFQTLLSAVDLAWLGLAPAPRVVS
jgi:hypothetical protein